MAFNKFDKTEFDKAELDGCRFETSAKEREEAERAHFYRPESERPVYHDSPHFDYFGLLTKQEKTLWERKVDDDIPYSKYNEHNTFMDSQMKQQRDYVIQEGYKCIPEIVEKQKLSYNCLPEDEMNQEFYAIRSALFERARKVLHNGKVPTNYVDDYPPTGNFNRSDDDDDDDDSPPRTSKPPPRLDDYISQLPPNLMYVYSPLEKQESGGNTEMTEKTSSQSTNDLPTDLPHTNSRYGTCNLMYIGSSLEKQKSGGNTKMTEETSSQSTNSPPTDLPHTTSRYSTSNLMYIGSTLEIQESDGNTNMTEETSSQSTNSPPTDLPHTTSGYSTDISHSSGTSDYYHLRRHRTNFNFNNNYSELNRNMTNCYIRERSSETSSTHNSHNSTPRKKLTRVHCEFCKRNGEHANFYKNHCTKNRLGEVTCPVLKRHVCDICGSTGKSAHTRTYCPQFSGRVEKNIKFRLTATGNLSPANYHK